MLAWVLMRDRRALALADRWSDLEERTIQSVDRLKFGGE